METTPKPLVRSFADKFSKIKSRTLFALWGIGFVVLLITFFPFISALYSITVTQKSYYTINLLENKAYYQRVSERPEGWVPLGEISKQIQSAIVTSEDGKFYEHPGYDLEQLNKAIRDSFVLKKKMRGASTITQQLVKNLFLDKDKTFGRKAKELVMSLMIERYADKQKILETYLNVIEYGDGLYGIKAASKFYFNKSPAKINAREAAFLAMLLPSPKKYAKSFKNKSLTPFASRMIASILLKMRQAGSIGELEYLGQLDGRFSWERVVKVETLPVEGLESEESDESEVVEGVDSET